jgi:hypothetical protein
VDISERETKRGALCSARCKTARKKNGKGCGEKTGSKTEEWKEKIKVIIINKEIN